MRQIAYLLFALAYFIFGSMPVMRILASMQDRAHAAHMLDKPMGVIAYYFVTAEFFVLAFFPILVATVLAVYRYRIAHRPMRKYL